MTKTQNLQASKKGPKTPEGADGAPRNSLVDVPSEDAEAASAEHDVTLIDKQGKTHVPF
jgi:hypothetical protein